MEKLYNMEAETQVLGGMLLDKLGMPPETKLLTVADFGEPRNQLVFQAVRAVEAQGITPSYVSVSDELERGKHLDAVGGLKYLMWLTHSFLTTAQMKSNIALIKEARHRREMVDFFRMGLSKALAVECRPQALMQEMVKTLQELESKQQVPTPDNCYLACELHQELEESRENPEASRGLTTGYEQLDGLLHGLHKGDFVILGARPSMGKTTIALNMAYAASVNEGKEPKHVLFVTLEMGAKQILRRYVSALTSIEANKMYESYLLTEGEEAATQTALDIYNQGSLHIVEEQACSVPKLREICYGIRQKFGLDMVVIDYLGLMTTNLGKERYTQVTELSRELKNLALELNVPLLALSQLNRNVEGRMDKRPQTSDLRESGALEQDADVVMLLYRDDYYNAEQSKDPNMAILEVAKHRNGATGEVELYFEKEHCHFMELL